MPSSVLPVVPETEVPTWKSPNELIHERINFDDTIWGFGLAGGAYYKTPLRITYVKPGSRAQMAHIYPGDVVLKINGIESSTLTLEQAHQMILESGIHLKINVTSPEDLEDNYFYYQDPLDELSIQELKPIEVKQRAIPKFPKFLGKCSHWSLQWPWKCKRKIIYKESNCYLVPSKFEEKHKDTRKPEVKEDDIVLDRVHNVKGKKTSTGKNKNKVINSGDNSKDLSENSKDVQKESKTTKQHDSVNKESENIVEEQPISLDQTKKDNLAENIDPDNENQKDDATDQISVIDKNHKNVSVEKNSSVDNNNENTVVDHNIALDKTDEELIVAQHGSLEETNNDIIEEENNSAGKTDESIVEPNISESDTDVHIVAEESYSDDKKDENGISEHNTSVIENDAENSTDPSDSMDKRTDIPGLSDSEKLTHNSR